MGPCHRRRRHNRCRLRDVLATGIADRLTGVSTPVAGTAELHQTINENGVLRMRPVSDGMALPPGHAVTFAPGGLHVMLMDLKRPLTQGDVFPLTLTSLTQHR